MKTIGIDCRFVGTGTGLARYTKELVSKLIQQHRDVEYVLFVRNEDDAWVKEMQQYARIVYAPFPHFSLKEQTVFPIVIAKAKIDLFFATQFNVPIFCPVPYVVTIHDLILHLYPNNANVAKQWAYNIVMSRSVRKSKQIIAVSDFTKKELIDTYSSKIKKKVTRVYEGVNNIFVQISEQEQAKILNKYSISKPYLLYVGNAKEHKNVPLLLEAFMKANVEGLHLVLISGGTEAEALTLPKSVIRVSNIADEEMPALYSGASACITASLYEGFGLPIAEAEACGCPVIATHQSAIPEVASPTANLIEPTLEAFTEAIQNFDQLERPQRSRFSSWKQCAEETAAVLQSCL